MGTPDLPISARRIWPSDPMKGLQAHGNFQVNGPDRGINHPDTKISPRSSQPKRPFKLHSPPRKATRP